MICSSVYQRYRSVLCFFFSSRRRHTRYWRDWSSDVCSSDLAIPVDEQIAEWFVNENLIPVVRRGWKKIVRNPVVIAIAIAALVISGVAAYRVYEHLHDFPGADKAR